LTVSPALSSDELAAYCEQGFVIRRGVFTASEMAELAAEADRLLRECADLIDADNLRCRFMPHADTGEKLFEVFDPVRDLSPLYGRLAGDARIMEAVESIYGEPACLFKEKLIFKPPGALGYHLHQDIPKSWPGFPRSFLTVLVPIDAGNVENGCTELFAGYHHGFLETDPENHYWIADGQVDARRGVLLALEPGDVAIFHGLTPHRSAPNRSRGPRRTFYVSYNARSDGGDQREAHYAEFHEKMRSRLSPHSPEAMYFR
jgi:hypothetical protein